MKKVVSVGILLSVVFFLEQMQICFGGNSTSGCIEGERRALLKLKQSFDDPWKRLASWNGEDCCRWSGVSCHTRRTGHVVHLDLRAPLIPTDEYLIAEQLNEYLIAEKLSRRLIAQQVDSSLAELTHLEYLDLSLNDFNRSRIPDFFGSFKHLTYLNLSWAGFGGKIVHQFGNLSSLKVLDLSGNYYGYADDFQWASSLSSLQHLDMSYVNLTTALDLIPTLTKLPSLLQLQLQHCGIGNTHFSVGSINSTFLARIQFLDLSWNELSGEIPNVIHNMTALTQLDLGYQLGWSYEFNGLKSEKMQWISSLSALQYLDMIGANLGKAYKLFQVLNSLPSLLRLQLSDCGIGNTHFSVGSINSTFLARIQFLDLSGNELSGEIPNVIHNMTALTELNLGFQRGYHEFNGLKSEKMQWISSLSALQYLDMTGANLGKAYKLFQVLNSLPSLLRLQLQHCGIGNTHFSVGSINSTFLARIQFLDLSWNELSGEIPNVIHNMTALTELNLGFQRGYHEFNGLKSEKMQWISSLSALQYLDMTGANLGKAYKLFQVLNTLPSLLHLRLSGCRIRNIHFSYAIANSTFFSRLPYLDLRDNQISGPIPHTLKNMTELIELDLSYNMLNSIVPQWLVASKNLIVLNIQSNEFDNIEGGLFSMLNNACSLKTLYLSDNPFASLVLGSNKNSSPCTSYSLESLSIYDTKASGTIPDLFGELKNLKNLYLPKNLFSGQIPSSVIELPWLESLDLSSNQFSGDVPNPLRAKFSSLGYLDLSMNQISGESLAQIFEAAPRIETLLLGSNHISGPIPNSFCKLENLKALDISKNKISGEIPNCIRELQQLFIINLSFNKISGKIPNSLGYLAHLERFHVNQNTLDGVLPLAMKNCTNLQFLDLGENKFSGSIPPWIGERLLSLRILRLRKNRLSNTVPPQLCNLINLQILDLAENMLVGEIPHCISNLKGMIAFPPTMLPEASHLYRSDDEWKMVKVSESTKGLENLEYTKKQLQLLKLLDLSSNNLAGTIPEELCLLNGLQSLKLSHNQLTGKIPQMIGKLRSLETLDLSYNKLAGEIPPSMSDLLGISHLNLSFNNLSGKIPTGNQLQTLTDPSIYDGNFHLCGFPLPKCTEHNDHSIQHQRDGDHGDDAKEKIWFWFVVTAGYATGLWVVIGTLVFKRQWRIAYFRFVENTKDKMLVMIGVKGTMLRKMAKKFFKE